MPQIVIVGAGLSGLTVAYRLRQRLPDARLTVLEPRDRAGGNIGTEQHDGFRVETGPNGFLDNKPGMMQLCQDLGLGDRLLAASEGSRKNRYVFVRNQLHRLPGSPLGILTTPLLSLAGKLALLREPFRPGRRSQASPEDESIAAFARRRFGREAADIFVDALVTGIHAGDPEQLSVRATFPRLTQYEAEFGSVLRGVLATAKQRKRAARERGEPPPQPPCMWSFREGLGVLVERLQHSLGTPIQFGVRVSAVTANPGTPRWTVHADGRDPISADAVVLTCPAHQQAPILTGLDTTLAEDIAGIPYNRIVVAVLGYRQVDVPVPRDGFGYIAPQNTRRDVLGVQWCSSIFPDRAPPGMVLWRALCGGVNRADVFDWDDATVLRACQREMQQVMGVRGEPVFTRIVRWPNAIPQYVCGHEARVARIEARLTRYSGLYLTGNSYHGVAMNDVTEQAGAIASQLADTFGK